NVLYEHRPAHSAHLAVHFRITNSNAAAHRSEMKFAPEIREVQLAAHSLAFYVAFNASDLHRAAHRINLNISFSRNFYGKPQVSRKIIVTIRIIVRIDTKPSVVCVEFNLRF